jgi:hypothetical protein
MSEARDYIPRTLSWTDAALKTLSGRSRAFDASANGFLLSAQSNRDLPVSGLIAPRQQFGVSGRRRSANPAA